MKNKKQTKQQRVLIAASLAALSLMLACSVFAAGVRQTIRLAGGQPSTTIQQSVLRGERDRYFLRARAGQKLKVSITSMEKNAVFQIYQPGRTKALKGAAETDDTTRWNGTLRITGNYTIVVGSTRGNAGYKLLVALS